ncbi:MAG: tRNA (adenosine(37)-N6)-threonylcarbamoyltransferase complex ATPase subunit type 1 TsaE [Patescibacteria group bacterium]|nr:tRNA (adenosine(37)-N6)-threonylcarbamoyltransferase complex ATPase subunit type 1 TsaE [Patescibacteria group bacterium]MDE2015136.1 tRNA (adenosine(37)-N6)-threonylcarbamoyltransferase complex ATPase subunit type 1 TsaE [Patescibacteria group bacterium]MDE2226564.1 tRNA (adenosine(37)-N6)-threonylcarbamoyltransferase complex ATPase subunit type 1 TsaE [Patescibacteria group bacterium]
MKAHKTFSSAETKVFGEKLAKKFTTPYSSRGALILALSGELGSGKTTFTQGFLRGLGIRKKTTSPTFIIFRRFAVKSTWFKNLYHVDAYRLKKPRELAALGFKEILRDPKNIVLIEWAENIKSILPKNALWLRFHHGKKENEREIKFSA